MNAPLISIIAITHLDENAPYLRLCLDSIANQYFTDFECLVISDANTPPVIPADPRFRAVHDKKLKLAGTKFNWGVKNSHPFSRYVMFISDDVMLSSNCLGRMVEGVGPNMIICNPMSNSDNGSQFHGDLGVPVKLSIADLPTPQASIDLTASFKCMQRAFLIPVRHFVAFYCTMMPRALWEDVGELDERMDFRHNDQDYCIRAANKGYPSMINLGAFALHFGDKTIPKCVTAEEMDECTRVFVEKHAPRNAS